ncbi:hypothetical protein AMECASPLE_036071 [Ameca splendens]|uniref:4-nitrophenyl phosphatase n=1 Tax=Ameca splendens TaxID=208324 RepID=A0ABV0YIL9_9TELE
MKESNPESPASVSTRECVMAGLRRSSNPDCGTLGLTVAVTRLRSPTSQPQPIGLLLQLDSVPYCRCPPPGSGIAAATGTADLTAPATGSSIDYRCREHGPLGLYVSNIPRNLVIALQEVGVEYIPGRGLCQTFPADPHYALGPAKSVRLSPLPADPTHHQSRRKSSPSRGDGFQSHSGPSSFGLLFDIDGVLVRGRTLIPGAKECFRNLVDRNGKYKVPVVFVTNAGNCMRQTKAEHLSHLLQVEVSPDQVMLSHSPLRMFTQFQKKCVLVSGQGPVEEVAHNLGFENVVTIDMLREAYPVLDFVDHNRRPKDFVSATDC